MPDNREALPRQFKSPPIRESHAPTMAVMATYSDRELLAHLLDLYVEMPDADGWDFDVEGHDEYEKISVERIALREAFRRLAEDEDGGA